MAKKLEKRWINRSDKYPTPNPHAIQSGVNQLVAQVLSNRGVNEEEETSDFLFPKVEHLHDPYLLNDMNEGVTRVLEAIGRGERITVYGDYDTDGATSTSVIMTYLTAFYPNVDFYIPHRNEGYGINKKALDIIKERGTKLVISVDCGITAMEEALHCKEIGMDIIITDHHEAGEVIPDCVAVINPRRKDNQYPYDSLAGVGVAYKFCVALQQELKIEQFSMDLREFLDLVAFGTVADIMPLTGENRVFVKYGLDLMNDQENGRLGIRALIEVAGLEKKKITAGQIGFQLGPRVNAIGRLAHVEPAVHMLLAKTKEEASLFAQQLNEANVERQGIQEKMMEDVFSKLPDPTDYEDHVIVMGHEDWDSGIKGIVASKVLDSHYRPTALFKIKGELAEGSARSIEDFDIKDALDQCADLLVKYGGHHGAAGMTVKTVNLDAFRERFNQVTKSMVSAEDLIPKIRYDAEVMLQDINFDSIEQFDLLEPFGMSNPSPTFLIRGAEVVGAKTMGKTNTHLKFDVKQGQHTMTVIAFGLGGIVDSLQSNDITVDIIGALSINDFGGKTSIQIELKDLKIKTIARPDHFELLDKIYTTANESLRNSNIENADSFYTKIVGVSFEGRQSSIQGVSTGDKLTLVRIYDNPHDSNAIAVMDIKGVQLGFLKAKISRDLARVLDAGVEYNVTVTSVNGNDENATNDTLGVNILVEKVIIETEEEEDNISAIRQGFSSLSDIEIFEQIQKELLHGRSFRKKQLEAITHLMNGENTISILGTGRGKSAIFQSVAAYKALKENKTTIIIYPLRALANDQLAGMRESFKPLGLNVSKGTGELGKEQRVGLWEDLTKGNIDILLTTPEFLDKNRDSFYAMKERIGFLVVDEGHHIGKATSTYRPSYRELTDIYENLDRPLLAVMTATCSEETLDSIQKIVPVNKIVIDPTVRSNLMIIDQRDLKAKDNYLANVVGYGDKTIIYVNSREKAVDIARTLRKNLPKMKDEIAFYHAGLNSEQRYFVEKLFRSGDIKTIVSTSAFGEGIDIPDIRHVIHYHMTFNPIEFNQESGRAGRNGEKAYIHLLFGGLDTKINDFILRKEVPSIEVLRAVYLYLFRVTNKGAYSIPVAVDQLARELSATLPNETIVDDTILVCMQIFKEFGFIEFSDSSDIYYITFTPPEGKVALEGSLRHQEGMAELQEFLEFSKWVMETDTMNLLRSINKPIYPTKLVTS